MPSTMNKIKAVVTGDDAERLERRQAIVAELAQLQAAEATQRDIARQVATLNQREAKALAAHEAATTPIQATLRDIERQVTAAIMAGEEVSAALAKQRAAALEALATANSKLETEVEVLKKLRKQCEAERSRLAPLVNAISGVRGKLSSRDVCDPYLWQDRFIAQQAAKWAEERRRAAQRELETIEGELRASQERRKGMIDHHVSGVKPATDGGPSAHERSMAQEADDWRAEVEAAEQAVAEAQEALAEIKRQIFEV